MLLAALCRHQPRASRPCRWPRCLTHSPPLLALLAAPVLTLLLVALQSESKVSGGAAAFSSTPFLAVAEERPVVLNTDLTEEEMETRLAGKH